MTTWTELARVTRAERLFLLQESSDDAMGVRTDDPELGTFGALLSREGEGWKIALVAPARFRKERAWKKSVRVAAATFPDLLTAAVNEILMVLSDMRFLDPTVVGDPAEDKAPAAVRMKLGKLRRRIADLEKELAAAKAEAAGVLAPGESDTFLARPVAELVGLGTGPSIEFAAYTGVIRGELVSGELIIDTGDGQLAVVPNARNSVTVRVVPRQERS